METREVKISAILNPTSIDLGEYVINPYKGCSFGCLYCYVRFNKVTKNDPRCWGEYVDVKVNAPQLLEKELPGKKPRRVLLGSTTECFQPVESRYKITYKILEILNRHKIYYSILTRSPLILEYIPLLKHGYCESIYFTVNMFSDGLKHLLEPKSAPFQVRIDTANRLLEEGLPVIPYLSPLFPYISRFPKLNQVEAEGLNFNLGNIDKVIDAIGSVYPGLKQLYIQMATDAEAYNNVWASIKAESNHHIYVHRPNSYFENKYRGEERFPLPFWESPPPGGQAGDRVRG